MKNYFIALNKSSADARVAELAAIAEESGTKAVDFSAAIGDNTLKGIAFLEPRFVPSAETFANMPYGSTIFGYAKNLQPELLETRKLSYACLSDDEKFIEENNYLTAVAMKQLLESRFGSANQKILIIGYGKLTAQLERVLTEAELHILNFNHHKADEIKKKYGCQAYFEKTELSDFPVIINTIPKQVIGTKELKKLSNQNAIYELASPPYGFDFGKLDTRKFDYRIEAALPGRFFPKQAAKAVFECMKRVQNDPQNNEKKSIVLCITGSPCSWSKLLPVLEGLVKNYNVIPVMSQAALAPNRFGDINEFKAKIQELTGNVIITTIAGSETLSSRKDIVASAVCPATGNTIAKLAKAITDTPVCMAVKALLRNSKPCIMGISTNDALSGNAENIGVLLNRKNYYFVPFSQDDYINKPFSMVCDFSQLEVTIDTALCGKQLQPIFN